MTSPTIDYASMFSLLQAWDTDGDGLVSSDDFKKGLSSIGFQISATDADTLCRALDTDGTGTIDAQEIEATFRFINDNHSGSVSRDEFEQYMGQYIGEVNMLDV